MNLLFDLCHFVAALNGEGISVGFHIIEEHESLVPFGEPCPRPAVVKAVKKMQAAGGKFVLSTGRGYCAINKQQLGGIRFDYAITNNGACVVDRDGAIIAEHPMTNEEMYALVDFCEDYNQ